MARARLLVENFFDNVVQFTGHTVAANEEATGFEVERLANGRRASDDYTTTTTANAQATYTITCDRVRAANDFRLDRGHNLAGETITLTASNDNFTTSETVFSLVVPSQTTAGPLSNGLGIVTEEGAWVIQFPLRAAKYWRLTIAAMGAGLKPQIVGAWLGLSFDARVPEEPWDDEGNDLIAARTETDGGWIGRGTPTRRRRGELRLKMESRTEYLTFRYHKDLFGHGLHTWVTFDTNQGDRTLLVLRDDAVLRFTFGRSWQPQYRQGVLPWVEASPKRI